MSIGGQRDSQATRSKDPGVFSQVQTFPLLLRLAGIVLNNPIKNSLAIVLTQRTYPTSPPPAYVQDSPKAKENMNVMTANAAASGSAQEQGSSSSSMTAVDPNRESES
nr:hypothetical protein L204_05947 [Cryptococcus depauperatus CBS 7855]